MRRNPSRRGVFARQPSAVSFELSKKLPRHAIGARVIENYLSLIAHNLCNHSSEISNSNFLAAADVYKAQI